MIDTKPEAYRLADELSRAATELRCLFQEKVDYLAELRRLHEEIKCEERRFSELWEQFAALDKTNQELLEALKTLIDMDVSYQRGEKVVQAVEAARAAIAKAEVTK